MVQFNPNLNVGKTVNLNQTTQAGAVDNTKPTGNTEAKPQKVYYVGDTEFAGMSEGDYVIGADGKAHKVFLDSEGNLCWKNRGGRKLTDNFLLNNCSNEGGLTWGQAMNLRDSFEG